MALKPKTHAKINRSMQRFVSYLKYRAIGPHALTRAELKELVRSGMITATTAPKATVARSYLMTHAQSTSNPAPKNTRDGAIDFLERMFARYADKAAQQLTSDLVGRIEAGIMPFTNREEGKNVYGLLRDKEAAQKHLGQALNDTVTEWRNRWKMICDTELARASNYGAMDAILHSNQNKAPEEILVYKVGPHDGAVCDECRRFWFWDDGVTPRVYLMSELIAGGSNIGKKRRDWKPTIDNTHPNERHFVLQELKPGYGFQGSKKVFISEDYDELGRQRAVKRK
jgi:hypothetical protein